MAASSLLLAVVMPEPARAQSVLTFTPGVDGFPSGIAITDPIPDDYGDIPGQLDFFWRTLTGGTGTDNAPCGANCSVYVNSNIGPTAGNMNWFDRGNLPTISGLTGVAFGQGANFVGVPEVAILPSSGYTVSLFDFALGNSRGTDQLTNLVVYDGDYNVLLSQNDASVLGGSPFTLSSLIGSTPLVSTSGFRFQWASGGNNSSIGIDNIAFQSSLIRVDPPQPPNPPNPPQEGDAVPGPLPVLGAGMAFGWSRKLRKRLAQRG